VFSELTTRKLIFFMLLLSLLLLLLLLYRHGRSHTEGSKEVRTMSFAVESECHYEQCARV
jgi:hypothetical protein